MPHSLTGRQQEVLQFIKEFIRRNEGAPRLEQIADHFGVKSPTAHKYLATLQKKGYLYFGRDSQSGFFIRLIERAGSAEVMVEIGIAGKADRYGELFDFPQKHGHFASVLEGVQPENTFALVVSADIPEANMLAGDLIIFDQGKAPQAGDICIAPIGSRLFLIKIGAKTFDEGVQSFVMAQDYPIPEAQAADRRQFLFWHPLAYHEDSHDYFVQVAEEEQFPMASIPPEFIVATALRMTRFLTS